MKFKSAAHKERYFNVLSRMKCNDCYHRSAAYLMALVPMGYDDVFDFQQDMIKHEGLYAAWQTHSSIRATRLMFNLWNFTNKDYAAENPETTYHHYTVEDIFYNLEYAPYFYEAVLIRYEWEEWA